MATRSSKQIAASRANGARSSGPSTPQGKLNSSRNSLRHGLLASTVVLEEEHVGRFLELLKRYLDEHQPRTATELSLVETMTVARWRQLRVWGMQKTAMDRDIALQDPSLGPACVRAVLALNKAHDTSCSPELLLRYEIAFDRQFARALARLNILQSKPSPPEPYQPPSPSGGTWANPETPSTSERTQQPVENADNPQRLGLRPHGANPVGQRPDLAVLRASPQAHSREFAAKSFSSSSAASTAPQHRGVAILRPKGVRLMKRSLFALSVFMLLAWLLAAADQDATPENSSAPGTAAPAGTGAVIIPRGRGVSPAAEAAIDPRSNIRVDKQLVLVPVAVTTPSGTYVTGLDKDMFRVFENNVEQTIETFSSEDAPMSVGVVFDTSGSMGNKLQRSRQAVAEFMKSANPEDEFLLVQFNDEAELTVPFTSNTEEVQNRLMFVQSKGRTALLDGVYMAMNAMKKAKNPRKAILIISDGGDNSSRYTQSEVRNSVREADVQIYAIGIYESLSARGRTPEEADGPDLLHDLTEQTGGRDFEVDNIGEMPDVAAKIGLELRNQYVLGYSPKNKDRDGRFRRIQVKLVKTTGLGQITPRWRLGYYAPSQ